MVQTLGFIRPKDCAMAAAKIEDLNLPASVVLRIIKDSIPDGIIVSKDARLAIGRAASMFVLYLTDLSNRIAIASGRKTVHGNDILGALTEGDFPQFIPAMKEALDEHKKHVQNKKQKSGEKGNEENQGEEEEEEDEEEDGNEED